MSLSGLHYRAYLIRELRAAHLECARRLEAGVLS